MAELKNFPFLTQLDGGENQLYDCVPASIAAGLEYLTGKRYTADGVKDAVYGNGYQGLQAASEYIDFCDKQGVTLFMQAGDVINIAHHEIQHGHPVVFTQQDDYSPNPNLSHVCVWYADYSGGLVAMDPFGAKKLDYSNSVWSSRLRSNEAWIMKRKDEDTVKTFTKDSKDFKNFGFTETTDGMWHVNGLVIGHAMKTLYSSLSRTGDSLPTPGLPKANEKYVKFQKGGKEGVVSLQYCERECLAFNVSGVAFDSQPGFGSGEAYIAHQDDPVVIQNAPWYKAPTAPASDPEKVALKTALHDVYTRAAQFELKQ